MAAPHLAEQVGRVLDGRYRVVAPIGTGASAAVYLADDTVLRRRVVIKVLHAALAGDALFLKRFQAEAHTAAALSHPNIMRVLDWGDGDEGPFLVLEYLGGGSLRAVLDQNPQFTAEQAVQIGIQAGRALDYAHRRGLVHRDIKPANLLFDEEGRLAIADFGLARALAEAALTEPGGAMLGTARYASPEQVRGQSLDGKADVYAVGLCLFEAVTGTVPFSVDTTLATLMGRLDKFVEVPEDIGPLGPIITAATHPDPAERISAGEMVEQLEAAAKELAMPEPLWLPGAIPADPVNIAQVDPTMLPDVSEHGTRVSVQARPLPPELAPKKRRRIRMPRVHFKRPPFKRIFTTLLLALLIAGAGFGAWTVYYKTGRELTVPTVTALSTDGARLAAKNADVKLALSNANSETVPAGETFEQTPAPGEKIHPREVVHARVSIGPLPRDVPNIVGQQFNTSRVQFAEKGLITATTNRFSETEPIDKVLSQDPPGGQLPKGATVHFVLSGGPAPRIIPSVQGMTQDAANAALVAEQLQVAVTEGFNDTVPVGQVAGTTPGAGASVARGSTVTLIISKGPELIAIPNVNAQSVPVASSTLIAAGFNVNNVYGPPTGVVFATNPASGAKVKKGSSVALYTR